MKRVVLAYSGGLDTSVIVRWLADRGFEVITYTADVGQGEELSEIEYKAKKAGAVKAIIDDIKEEFAEGYCLPLMRASALYEGKYTLLSSLSRPLIAKKLVEVAHRRMPIMWLTVLQEKETTRLDLRPRSGPWIRI